MASFRKRGEKWEVSLCINGVRRSATRDTKREASEWVASQTVAIKSEQESGVSAITVEALLTRYRDEVTPRKRGHVKEAMSVNRLLLDVELTSIKLNELRPFHLGAWRDRRLAKVTAATVRRDWSLLSHVFSVGVREWEYLKENPLRKVIKPKPHPSRDRRITEHEITKILLCLGYSRTGEAKTVGQRVAVAFLFAIETGMRQGEILSLRRESIQGNVAHLAITKNGFPRMVPLSSEAVRLLHQLPQENEGAIFDLGNNQLKSAFRRMVKRAEIPDLHFHDTRHEAITRLARKLDVLDLARMVGTRELKILMVYYNATATEIAARLG